MKVFFFVLFFTIKCLFCYKNKHMSFLQADEENKITINQFYTKLTLSLMNGLEYPTFDKETNDLNGFTNNYRKNRIYRCRSAQILQFSNQIFFSMMTDQMTSMEKDFDVKYGLPEIIKQFQQNAESTKTILQQAFFASCHITTDLREKRIMKKIDQDLIKFRQDKIKLLDLLPDFLDKMIQQIFYQKNYGEVVKFQEQWNQTYSHYKDFWESEHQKEEIFQSFYLRYSNIFKELALEQPENEDKAEDWLKSVGELFESHIKLRLSFARQSPLISMKRQSAQYFQKLDYFLKNLTNFLDHDFQFWEPVTYLRQTIFLMEGVGGSFTTIPNWMINFVNQINQESEEEEKGVTDIFWTQKTCSTLQDVQTITKLMSNINENFDDLQYNGVTALIDYKKQVFKLFNICKENAEICLEAINVVENKQVMDLIHYYKDDFSSSLIQLRKYGPISDIQRPITHEEQITLIKMGYEVLELHHQDKNILGLWACRSCGGGQYVKDLKIEKGGLFKTDNYNIQNNLVYIQLDERNQTMLKIEFSNNQEQVQNLVRNILFDNSMSYEITIEALKLQNLDLGFLFKKGYWNNIQQQWLNEQLPTIPDDQHLVLTKNCKFHIFKELPKQFEFKYQYNDFEIWELIDSSLDVEDNLSKQECEFIEKVDIEPNYVYCFSGEILKQDLDNHDIVEITRFPILEETMYLSIKKRNLPEKIVEISPELIEESLNDKPIDTELKQFICKSGGFECKYLEDDANEVQEEIQGDDTVFPVEQFTYTKTFNPGEVNDSELKMCAKYDKKFQNVDGVDQVNKIIEEFGNPDNLHQFEELADNMCLYSHTFKLEFDCDGDIKYLVINQDNEIQEKCIKKGNIEQLEELSQFDEDQLIPILDQFYFVVTMNTNYDIITMNEQIYEDLGYYDIAYWLGKHNWSINNKFGLKFTLHLAFFVKIDNLNHNYLGLQDQTTDFEQCSQKHGNWFRFTPNHIINDTFSDTTFERAIYNSIEPIDLRKLKYRYGIGMNDFILYNDFLGGLQCRYGQFFIPILWTGHDSDCFDQPDSIRVKSVEYSLDNGINEICDGTQFCIEDVYYLEIIIFEDDVKSVEAEDPTPQNIETAKKHGYVYQKTINRKPYSYVWAGVSTITRLWVKPCMIPTASKDYICED